jgi:nucleotide-binding universal stress UspA family protein
MTAELLVVGHLTRCALGSTTHGVLHRATCPVAVVPLPALGRG